MVELSEAKQMMESTKVALMAVQESTENIVGGICNAIVKAEQSNLKVSINDEGLAQLNERNYTRDIRNFRLKAGMSFEYYDYHSDMFRQNGSRLSPSSDHFLNYFVSCTMDTYDRLYYPTHGSRIQIQGIVYTDNGIQYDDDTPFGEVAIHAETALKLNRRFYLLPSLKSRLLFGSSIPAIYQNCAGGFSDANYLPWQMAWETVQHVHLLERNVITGRLAFRYRVKGKFYLTALGEYGKEAHKTSRIFSGNNLWGCALRASYDFVLGPIGVQTNYSNLGKNVGICINAGFKF